jgi:hypothetical protein
MSLVTLLACSPMTLSELTLDVDFGADADAKSATVSQTPSSYRVALQGAQLSGENPFELFQTTGPTDVEVYAFEAEQEDTRSLLEDQEVPEEAFSDIELRIVYLEMDLEFRFDQDGSVDERAIRIYFEPTGTAMPGDVTVVTEDSEGWVFGAGNVTEDPMLLGLDRMSAYGNEGTWPDGRSVAESGPFGNEAFWGSVRTMPFTWVTPLPEEIDDETVHIVVKVADTWNYTDQAEDGVYDWPTDYGNAWNMHFPEIIAE